MGYSDTPIKSKTQDLLGRKKFATQLAQELLNWDKEDSLVVALYGEWGSGKSSVINMAREYIQDVNRKDKEYKDRTQKGIECDNEPIIIEFNPWSFSEEKNLTLHFFNEIANELGNNKYYENYKKVVANLKLYASALSLFPSENVLSGLSAKLLRALGIIGIVPKPIMDLLGKPTDVVSKVTLYIGLVLFVLGTSRTFLLWLAGIFEQKYLLHDKSASELKLEIIKLLRSYNKEKKVKKEKKSYFQLYVQPIIQFGGPFYLFFYNSYISISENLFLDINGTIDKSDIQMDQENTNNDEDSVDPQPNEDISITENNEANSWKNNHKTAKKIIVIIDDIDRLDHDEVKLIFRLIRNNADFPNTIYLLSFDPKIVEKNIHGYNDELGKNYLEKIIQVHYNMPRVNNTIISKLLDKELLKIMNVLPDAYKYFGQVNIYWNYINFSGFKELFKNIRDIKRFANSLEYNISVMIEEKTLEVNPVDFVGIEAIRFFAPNVYIFMRGEKMFFTSSDPDKQFRNKDAVDPRKTVIESVLNGLPPNIKNTIRELLKRLFPRIKEVYDNKAIQGESQREWRNDLRVCSTSNFDSYFTFIPGGDIGELSQAEIDRVLSTINSVEKFEAELRKYITNYNKLSTLIMRVQDFLIDQNRIPQANVKYILQALFNISDDLPEPQGNTLIFGLSDYIINIIDEILERNLINNNNFEILFAAITESKSLNAPIRIVASESSKKNTFGFNKLLIPEEKYEQLEVLCVDKILSLSDNDILKNKNLIFIIEYWMKWDKEKSWNIFIGRIIEDEAKLLQFIKYFMVDPMDIFHENDYRHYDRKFKYIELRKFIDLDVVKVKFESIKSQNLVLYNNNKVLIDLFLDNFDQRDKPIF